MKISSVAWGWTRIPEQVPTRESIINIAVSVKELGFDLIDYLTTWETLDCFFNETECLEISKHTEDIGLEVGTVVFQSDIWNNPDKQVQNKQLEYFKKCANAAKLMGAGLVSCIIPGPFGAKPNIIGSPSEKIASNLPADYNWQKDWELFVEMISAACTIAAESDLKVALECFPGTLCPNPHAMQRLLKEAGANNLGIQLDTAHLVNQKIDVETAIYMLGGENIFNVHAKDSDGLARNNLPAGCGITDYTSVIKALGHNNYKGNISIEVEFTDNPKRYMKQAYDHLKLCIEGLY